MTKKELKKLSRAELLEMLLIQTKKADELQLKNKELEELLEDRRVAVSKVGSIAEAAMELNGVFEAAQQAADQYLEHVKEMWIKTEKLCAQKQQEAEQMLKKTKEECLKLEEKTRFQCLTIQEQSRQESDCSQKQDEKISSFLKRQEEKRTQNIKMQKDSKDRCTIVFREKKNS